MHRKKTTYWTAGLWREKPTAWYEPLPGVRRRVLANAQSATLGLFRIAKGAAVGRHHHPHAQFGVCLEGGGTFTIGGKVWRVKAGDSWYIPPGVPHEFRNDARRPSLLVEAFTPQREEAPPDQIGASV